MTYGELLRSYMSDINCSVKELASVSGLPAATLSRYRSGERTPSKGSGQYNAVIDGLVKIAESHKGTGTKAGDTNSDQNASGDKEAGISDISENFEKKLREDFSKVFKSSDDDFDFSSFRLNLSRLISELHITMGDIAQGTGYDISYISRIRMGTRRPAKPHKMVQDMAEYIVGRLSSRADREVIAELLDIRVSEVDNSPKCVEKLFAWLFNGDNSPRKHVENFINQLDVFNIETYASERSITDYGSEKDILDSESLISYRQEDIPAMFERVIVDAVSSGDKNPITIYWDMSDADISCGAKLKSCLTYAIEKGHFIRLVHADNSPTNEMTTWLENWMPLYMSGQIESYYLEEKCSDMTRTGLVCSENMVCIMDMLAHHSDVCRMYLTRNKDEVGYYHHKLNTLIGETLPLIDVIRYENREERRSFMKQASEKQGSRKTLLSTPPIYTMNSELIDKILTRNNISSEDKERIRDYIADERRRVENTLEKSSITDYIPDLSPENYENSPVFLSLSGLFYDKDIFYTYDEYLEHMRLTREWEKNHDNYSLVLRRDVEFRNIQIFMHKGAWVMISKNKTPAIHFVVRHPGIREALEQMLDFSALN